jgi:hypothetical protein
MLGVRMAARLSILSLADQSLVLKPVGNEIHTNTAVNSPQEGPARSNNIESG